MTTNTSTQANDWFQAQQQYWDQWFQSQRGAVEDMVKKTVSPQGQWGEFFQQWQKSVSPGSSIPNASNYQQFFANAGQQYLNMMQQFQGSTGQAKAPADAAKEWTENLQKFFTDMFQKNSQPFDTTDVYKKFTAFNENMTKAAQSWTSGLQSGGPFAQGWNMPGAQAMPDMSNLDPFGFYASIPGVGYAREKQDAQNKLYKLWAQYEAQSREYNAAMAKVGLEATQKFQEYLSNPPKDAAPITSLKGIFAKWVDICEDVYAKYAMSKEYTKLYGDVVNALMAYKKQMNAQMDENLEQFNLPTRQEIDALHKTVHALTRENQQMRKELDALTKKPASRAKAAPVKVAKKVVKKGKK